MKVDTFYFESLACIVSDTYELNSIPQLFNIWFFMLANFKALRYPTKDDKKAICLEFLGNLATVWILRLKIKRAPFRERGAFV